MKILLLRLSSIGDILLTTPFIRQTRKQFPESTIHFLTKSTFADLVRYNPHLDRVITFDPSTGFRGLKQLRQNIRDQQYDFIFDLHSNLRSNYLLRRLGYPRIVGIHKSRIKRALLVYLKINLYREKKPIPLRYLDVGRMAGIADDGEGLELFWDESVGKKVSEYLAERNVKNQYIILAPGAGYYTKQWPLDYFRQLTEYLCRTYSGHILLAGSEKERGTFEILQTAPNVINLAGDLSLLESACLISDAGLVLANDSGIGHMAAAVNAPVITIFGSTVEEFGFFPFRAQSTVIQHSGLWCRPCSHVGRKRCPLGHFRCMMELKPERVIEQVQQYIGEK